MAPAFVSVAPGMHEATAAGFDSNGHTASGGDAIVISSRIEIMAGGYRQSLEFVDAFMDPALGRFPYKTIILSRNRSGDRQQTHDGQSSTRSDS